MKKTRNLILYLTMTIFSSCNLDADAANPKASMNMQSSKEDGFFINEYSPKNVPDSIFHIRSAWTEYSWKNNVKHGDIVKERRSGTQLVLEIDRFYSNQFKNEEYLLNWRMGDSVTGFVGRANGSYVIFLKNGVANDSITIKISRIKEDRTAEDVSSFTLKRNQ